MPLLLRTSQQDRDTMVDVWLSQAMSMLMLLQDDAIYLDIAYLYLLFAYMSLLRVSQPARRNASAPAALEPACY